MADTLDLFTWQGVGHDITKDKLCIDESDFADSYSSIQHYTHACGILSEMLGCDLLWCSDVAGTWWHSVYSQRRVLWHLRVPVDAIKCVIWQKAWVGLLKASKLPEELPREIFADHAVWMRLRKRQLMQQPGRVRKDTLTCFTLDYILSRPVDPSWVLDRAAESSISTDESSLSRDVRRRKGAK